MSAQETSGSPQITPNDPEHTGSRRDPEERRTESHTEHAEKLMDKTLADSFPTSDPPSTTPHPSAEAEARSSSEALEQMVGALAPGTWAAISIDEQRIVGTGTTREEAEQQAKEAGYPAVRIMQAPSDADAPLQAPDAA